MQVFFQILLTFFCVILGVACAFIGTIVCLMLADLLASLIGSSQIVLSVLLILLGISILIGEFFLIRLVWRPTIIPFATQSFSLPGHANSLLLCTVQIILICLIGKSLFIDTRSGTSIVIVFPLAWIGLVSVGTGILSCYLFWQHGFFWNMYGLFTAAGILVLAIPSIFHSTSIIGLLGIAILGFSSWFFLRQHITNALIQFLKK